MSYLKTKLRRKKTKYQNILTKSLNVNVSETPCKVLVICNGGLVNGITQEMILEAFGKYGEIENIIMVPEKSFSFIEFKALSDAEMTYEKVNGNVVWSEIKGPIYLGFVEKLPDNLTEMNFNFVKPPGLIVLEKFITPEEEDIILAVVGFQEDDKNLNSSELKHRKVKHYGYEFKYSTNNVCLEEPIDPIPVELDFLWSRLSNHPEKNDYNFNFNYKPDQLTVNCYKPGQGIPPHVDTHSPFTDGILSLSLQSDVVMDFKHTSGKCCSVLLPRRSLCIMSGEARYDWTHGITPRKSDIILAESGGLTLQYREIRTSLTFRKTRISECECNYPNLCDSRKKKQQLGVLNGKMDLAVKENDAAKLEESYVHEVYEKIASHFSETRHKPWPNVAKFMESFHPGSILVDVGCGNGKYFSSNNNRYEIGCDSSFNLMQVCRERGFECFTCNCLNIPLRDNIADGCISIAVIHHLATKERRMKAIEEIIRILKIGGKALIYVWAKNQERQNQKSSYLKQYNKKKEKEVAVEKILVEENVGLPVHTNRTNFHHSDLLVPWKLKPKDSKVSDISSEPPVFLRFYHVFEDNEIKEMCLGLDNVEIKDYYYDQGNWCILLEKIK